MNTARNNKASEWNAKPATATAAAAISVSLIR
jgi:hypothetical protein